MTIIRFATAGAVILNVATAAALTPLSPGTIALSALVHAMIGAALGAVTGWALIDQAPQSTNRERLGALTDPASTATLA